MGKRKNRRKRRKRDTGDGAVGWGESAVKWVTASLGLCGHVVQPVTIYDPTGEFTVYAGGKMDMQLKDMTGVDVQVPLCELVHSAPYSMGFKGRIWLTPAPDGGVWPLDVYAQALDDIRAAAQADKKVLIYCLGGHGRTGTMLAGLVSKFEGAKDPIGTVRQRYCKEAVEGWRQCRIVYEVAGKEAPAKYANEKGWWEYADYKHGTHVYYPATSGVNPTTGTVDVRLDPEDSKHEIGMSVKTNYGSVQQWSDKHGPPAVLRQARPKDMLTAPTISMIKRALTDRYGDIDRLSSLVKRVLSSSSLTVLHGYGAYLWWVYGDGVPTEAGVRWECFIIHYGHPTKLDGQITLEYGRTRIAPTLTGTLPAGKVGMEVL